MVTPAYKYSDLDRYFRIYESQNTGHPEYPAAAAAYNPFIPKPIQDAYLNGIIRMQPEREYPPIPENPWERWKYTMKYGPGATMDVVNKWRRSKNEAANPLALRGDFDTVFGPQLNGNYDTVTGPVLNSGYRTLSGPSMDSGYYGGMGSSPRPPDSISGAAPRVSPPRSMSEVMPDLRDKVREIIHGQMAPEMQGPPAPTARDRIMSMLAEYGNAGGGGVSGGGGGWKDIQINTTPQNVGDLGSYMEQVKGYLPSSLDPEMMQMLKDRMNAEPNVPEMQRPAEAKPNQSKLGAVLQALAQVASGAAIGYINPNQVGAYLQENANRKAAEEAQKRALEERRFESDRGYQMQRAQMEQAAKQQGLSNYLSAKGIEFGEKSAILGAASSVRSGDVDQANRREDRQFDIDMVNAQGQRAAAQSAAAEQRATARSEEAKQQRLMELLLQADLEDERYANRDARAFLGEAAGSDISPMFEARNGMDAAISAAKYKAQTGVDPKTGQAVDPRQVQVELIALQQERDQLDQQIKQKVQQTFLKLGGR